MKTTLKAKIPTGTDATASAPASQRSNGYDKLASVRTKYRKRNAYYHSQIEQRYRFVVPAGSKVLEIGCATGDLLAALEPSHGVGIDFSGAMLEEARSRHPHLEFQEMNAESLDLDETFDYVIISGLLGDLEDIQAFFSRLRSVTRPDTRVIIDYYNHLWEPLVHFAEWVGLKMPTRIQNWLPLADIENLLYLNDFEVVKQNYVMLLPKSIPPFTTLMNRFLARLPGFRKLSLVTMIVAKERGWLRNAADYSTTVVIPTKDEKGNIEEAVLRTPSLGNHTEIIFVDGNSTDGTADEIRRVIAAYPDRDIKFIPQGNGTGKGDAVRKGFTAASGDVLMILDADLTVPPEDLPKFFNALIEGKGEFINGTRLVYQMDEQAMRFLNFLGNKFFSMAFSWLLEQRLRDTLCGTKVLFKKDYEKIAAGRHFFGDFDPFGDFDLLFGAAKQHLKIVEVPIRYRERTYGETSISRFTHGWLLLKMVVFASKKLKFV
jgi:ubiquinone/menaquinone biosynthesis C-methylase UbiE